LNIKSKNINCRANGAERKKHGAKKDKKMGYIEKLAGVQPCFAGISFAYPFYPFPFARHYFRVQGLQHFSNVRKPVVKALVP